MTRPRIVRCTILMLLLGLAGICEADTVHTVAKGETPYGIARLYGISLQTLMEDNGLSEEDVTRVAVGARLVIRDSAGPQTPSSRGYTVRKDDTLYRIALNAGCTVEDIERLNPGVDALSLKVGVEIQIPAPEDPESGTDPDETGHEVAADPTLWPHAGDHTIAQRNHVRWVQIRGAQGDDVVAVASGRVVWSAPFQTYRNVVIIEAIETETNDAFRFWYAGNEEVFVRAGDWIEKGMVIASMGVDPLDGAPRVSFAVTNGLKIVDHTLHSWQ